jgi:ABC-type Fe3+ transport system permease subunit
MTLRLPTWSRVRWIVVPLLIGAAATALALAVLGALGCTGGAP